MQMNLTHMMHLYEYCTRLLTTLRLITNSASATLLDIQLMVFAVCVLIIDKIRFKCMFSPMSDPNSEDNVLIDELDIRRSFYLFRHNSADNCG
jgi:hypothetical protein